MWIYLFRHGIAIDREHPDCPPDSQRALTEKGVRRTRDAARGLAALGVEPDLVLTSPYVRARQTAELALEALSLPLSRLVESDALLDDDPEPLCYELRRLDPEVALCVGHAPSLDLFAAYLVGSGRPVTRLKKAGVACLEATELAAGGAALVSVYTPRALRLLGALGTSEI